MKKLLLFCLSVMFFCQCSTSMKDKDGDCTSIKFGRIEIVNTSVLQQMNFVKLETSDECLIEEINQIEVFNDKIYILDDAGLYVFGLDGKYLQRLYRSGDGPGEFLSPFSFWIDKEGFIFILDRILSRLQKYDIESLDFVEQIVMPFQSPVSFAKIPNQDLYIHYYPLRPKREIDKKQMYIADKNGNIKKTLLDGKPSGKILHGDRANIYLYNNKLRFYPHFSNSIYQIGTDSLYAKYELSYKQNTFPDEKIFIEYDDSNNVMKEIIQGDHNWIRLIYVYETKENLVVKYYIKRDFYVSVLNKATGNTINFKYDQVKDDCGIGGKFPLPICVYKERFIGQIKPFDIDKDQVTNPQMKALMDDVTEESNPILVFYSIKI